MSHRLTPTAALTLGLILAPWAPASPAPAGFCALSGLEKFTWQGDVSTAWGTAANWSNNKIPGEGEKTTGYVCIPAGKTVVVGAEITAYLQAIDIAGSSTLTLQRGSKLYVYGNKSTRPSSFRKGSTVTVSAATLGGTGAYTVAGRLNWLSEVAGASSIRSRSCQAGGDTCTGPLPAGAGGLLTVTESGLLDVAADALNKGVNLRDQYRIVVRGKMVIHGVGFVAADDGTTLELRPKVGAPGVGEMRIEGDGGWYQGFVDGSLGLTKIVNEGKLVKAAGTGVSGIEAQYQRVGSTTGAEVKTGTLMLPAATVLPTKVAKAANYGTGRCHVYDCQPAPTSDDRQVVSVKVPATDTDGATVTINETTEAGLPGQLVPPVQIIASGLTATASSAALLTLRYDANALAAASIGNVGDIAIWRKPEGSTGVYAKVLPCVSGVIPTGKDACVDRRAAWTKLVDGDAVITVRTKKFSRWVARDNSYT